MGYDSFVGVPISSSITRYIIPFSYDVRTKEQKGVDAEKSSYEYACEALESCTLNNKQKTPKWVRVTKETAESECYDYMRTMYGLNIESDENGSAIGSIWSQNLEQELHINTFKKKGKEAFLHAKISQTGLYLLKNNIGLFWYELEFDEDVIVTVDQLVEFQNAIKELAGQMGNVRIKLSFDRNAESLLDSNKLGLWINNQISSIGDCEISYYPHRLHNDTIKIPDKALLFNYVSVDETQFPANEKYTALECLAFYLTKGFKKSYKPVPGFESEMVSPFENIRWYAQREGCGVYVTYSEDNKGFFGADGFKGKVGKDYFHLYMTLLQQSFVLLRFSEEIAYTLSADKHKYKNIDSSVNQKLEDLERRINLFLMKNIYASVGFTDHHNRYYAYVEKVLNIQEDIKALTSGMVALEEVLRRQKEQMELAEKKKDEENDVRIQRALVILTGISVFSIPTIISEFFSIDLEHWNFIATGIKGFLDQMGTTELVVDIFVSLVYLSTGGLIVLLGVLGWPIIKGLFKKDK